MLFGTPLLRASLLRGMASSAAALAAFRSTAAGAQTAAEAMPLNVGLFAAPDMAAILYAQQQELFRKAGLDVHTQTMQNGAAAMSAESGGSLDIAYGNVFTVVQAHSHGLPVKLVFPGSLYESSLPTIKLVVPGDSMIKTAADLRDKTIGVSLVHDITGLSLKAWLAAAGVDAANVHFLELPPPLMLSSLQSHRIDAALTFDPFLSAALAGGARALATPFDAIGNNFLASGWFTLAPWATAHMAAVRAFAGVMGRASAYVNDHYEETLPLLADYTKLPLEVLRRIPHVPTPPSVKPAMLQPVIDVSAKFQEIPARFNAADLILTGVA